MNLTHKQFIDIQKEVIDSDILDLIFENHEYMTINDLKKELNEFLHKKANKIYEIIHDPIYHSNKSKISYKTEYLKQLEKSTNIENKYKNEISNLKQEQYEINYNIQQNLIKKMKEEIQ